MTPGLVVTRRDLALLHDLYCNVQLSFSQIHRRHFPGRSRSTVANRLSRLKRASLVVGHRIGMVGYQGCLEPVGSVYQVGRKGVAILEQDSVKKDFRPAPPRLSLLSLSHDLALTEVMDALKQKYPEGEVRHGKLFEHAGERGGVNPDAIILDRNGGAAVAIELELTPKSESRYRQIILQYRQDARFKRVLYIVNRESTAAKIKYQITGQKMIKGIPEPTTGKFEFVTLQSLLSHHSRSERDHLYEN